MKFLHISVQFNQCALFSYFLSLSLHFFKCLKSWLKEQYRAIFKIYSSLHEIAITRHPCLNTTKMYETCFYEVFIVTILRGGKFAHALINYAPARSTIAEDQEKKCLISLSKSLAVGFSDYIS